MARQLFFDHGLEAVTMDHVTLSAGVSKMTVYANFSDKVTLFEAVVDMDSARIDAAFGDIQIGADSIQTVLTRVGTTLITFLLSPEVMRLDHLLSSETNNHPGLGQRFYQVGPNRMWQALTDIIKTAVARREIRTDDAKQAAEDLIALWLGMVPLQHRFNQMAKIAPAVIAARVIHGVDVFMKMYGGAD
jgi:TetR/AcrR family transcriptional regulator, mexJK operon transcriptional repressor